MADSEPGLDTKASNRLNVAAAGVLSALGALAIAALPLVQQYQKIASVKAEYVIAQEALLGYGQQISACHVEKAEMRAGFQRAATDRTEMYRDCIDRVERMAMRCFDREGNLRQ